VTNEIDDKSPQRELKYVKEEQLQEEVSKVMSNDLSSNSFATDRFKRNHDRENQSLHSNMKKNKT